ncbi:MAG: U32 family peptidase [Bacteroidaceae bacterium]|nr:U32 family peptidase [Bacteroidaceae bacterium]
MREIELLSPAKNADIGIEAIRHGADAVYIGATSFGARAAAGNSIEDIARLVEYAHLFKARVYVTVNTIIFDNEMKDAEELIWKLHGIKVDALIIQDLRLLSLNLPPIPLHASTQMDNRTVEKVEKLAQLGFPQVVLARELTIKQISDIHKQCPDTELEVFVHGALCVSLSGRCNASEALFGRSANRGECAQVCRMKFDLKADGHTLVKDKHLLSLRDNCQINNLEQLLLAGATSLKIEGRLKDADYVKNITAAYSAALNAVIAKHPEKFCRRSSGHTTPYFTPDIYKSFNRGFVKNVNKPEANLDTPKSMGEPVDRSTQLHNGDGLCYIDKGQLVGFRISNVERFRPIRNIHYFRNQDAEWDKLLAKPSSTRAIYVDISITDSSITMTDEDGIYAAIDIDSTNYELARSPQTENIKRQMSKLGGTIFEARTVDVNLRKNFFIPSSQLATWRRQLSEQLTAERLRFYPQIEQKHSPMVIPTEEPYELNHSSQTPLMICHHCIRRQLGLCLKQGGQKAEMTLTMANGTVFRLDFDCKNCLMYVYKK